MKALTNIFVSLIFIVVLMKGIIEQIFLYPKNSTIPKFRKKLRKLGYRLLIDIEPESFCHDNTDETKDLVLEFYNKIDDRVERELADKSFYIECLWFVKDFEVFDFLTSELKKYSILEIDEKCILDLLYKLSYTTIDLSHKDEYIKMLEDNRYYVVSEELLKICSNFPSKTLNELLKRKIDYNYDNLAKIALEIYTQHNPNDKGYINKNKKKKYLSVENGNDKILKEDDDKLVKGEYPVESTIDNFIKQLISLSNIKFNRSEIIEFCQKNQKMTKNLIMEFYKKSTCLFDQRIYLRCLMNAGNKDLFDFIYNEIDKHSFYCHEYKSICFKINNYFIKSSDKKFNDRYINLIKKNEYNDEFYGIFYAIIEIKSIEAEPYILNMAAEDEDLREYVVTKYLSKVKKNDKYQEIFEQYLKSDNPEIRALCRKNLEKIKKNKNIK